IISGAPVQPGRVDEPEISATSSESQEATEAPKTVLVWRPARFERRRPHHRAKADGGRSAKGKSGQGGDMRQRRARHTSGDGHAARHLKSNERQGKREDRAPAIDPDSAFAKLAALKEQLQNRGS